MSSLTPRILIDTGRSRFWICENFSADIKLYLDQLTLLHEPPSRMGIQHRDIGFYSDTSIGYKYSGYMIPSQKLSASPILPWLLNGVNQNLGTNFNGILVNKYIDGSKSLGAHSDDEGALDKNRKMVAGLAYGAVRTFRIRDKATNNIVLDYEHTPCTLIVMEGDFQSEFKHEIPKQLRVTDERISVTFRHHLK